MNDINQKKKKGLNTMPRKHSLITVLAVILTLILFINNVIPISAYAAMNENLTNTRPHNDGVFNSNITSDYEYVYRNSHMPYVMHKPLTDNTNAMPLIIWLHDRNAVDTHMSVFLETGLSKAMSNYNLMGFNAYVVIPHMTGKWNTGNWQNETAATNIKTVIDTCIKYYNIDINRIIIAGHGIGAQGSMYIAASLPNTFSDIIVFDGSNPGINISNIDANTIGYVTKQYSNENNHGMRYMLSDFATTFGHNRVITLNTTYHELSTIMVTMDNNSNHKPDILERLFATHGAMPDDIMRINSYETVPLYWQTDYPDIPYSQGTIATSGCGITCIAMVASYLLNMQYTPADLARYNYSAGSNDIRMENAGNALGIDFVKTQKWDDVIAALKNGQLVPILVNDASIFTNYGHFVLLTGIDENGIIYVNDPNGANYRKLGEDRYANGFDEATVKTGFVAAWVYEPKAN